MVDHGLSSLIIMYHHCHVMIILSLVSLPKTTKIPRIVIFNRLIQQMDAHGLDNSYKYYIETVWTSLPHIIPYCVLLPGMTWRNHSHAMITACNLLHLNWMRLQASLPNTPQPLPELFILCNLCVRSCCSWTMLDLSHFPLSNSLWLCNTQRDHTYHTTSPPHHTDGTPGPPANPGAWTRRGWLGLGQPLDLKLRSKKNPPLSLAVSYVSSYVSSYESSMNAIGS